MSSEDDTPSDSFLCNLCNKRFLNEANFQEHVKGKRHQRRVGRVVKEANLAFNKLDTLNAWLVKLKKESPQKSCTAAIKILKKIHVNIFDLVEERYIVHKSVEALARYTIENNLFFPRRNAKSEGLRCFLRELT
jgi:hypothetical protein